MLRAASSARTVPLVPQDFTPVTCGQLANPREEQTLTLNFDAPATAVTTGRLVTITRS